MIGNQIVHQSPRAFVLRRIFRAAPVCLLLLGGLLSLSSCSLPDETAALVNDRPVATADLEVAYENFIAPFSEMAAPGGEEAVRVKKVLLERLVDRELMLQEVEKRGLQPSDQEIAEAVKRQQGVLREKEFEAVLAEAGLDRAGWRRQIVRDLSVQKLQEAVVSSQVAITDEEIEALVEKSRIGHEEPGEVRASQILVRTREEALTASRRIKGGETFAAVAREISLSPDAEQGGDLGYFARGQMPQEFDAVAFSIPVGKLSPAVETTYGYHLFLVTDKREARLRSDDEIREEVRRSLAAEKREKAFRVWLDTLRKTAKIRYNDTAVSP